MKQFIRVIKAVSDPSRVKILKILQSREMCVCELQSLLELAQPTVSKHLKLLEDAGLVGRRKDKMWVNYCISDGSESIYAERILRELRGWLNDDQEIVELTKKASVVDRRELRVSNYE